jgi:cation transport ATPase
MGILSRIFAKPEDASKVIDGAVAGFDKMFFTKEEKAEANQKLSEWYLKYLAATESQNIARRFIAMVVVLLWALMTVFGVAVRWFNNEMSDFVFKILTEVVMTPFSIVVGFYFLTHAVRSYTSSKK